MGEINGSVSDVRYLLKGVVIKEGGQELYFLDDKERFAGTNSVSMCGYKLETLNSCDICTHRYDGDCGNNIAKEYFGFGGGELMPSALDVTYSDDSGLEVWTEKIDVGPYCRFCVPRMNRC